MYRFTFVLVALMACKGQGQQYQQLRQYSQPQQNIGQPLQQPGQPLQESSQPLQQPGQPLQQPGQPLQQPGQPLQESSQPLQQPGQPLQQPGQPLQQPGQPLQQPGQPLQQPDQPLQQPGQPLQQPGQPLQDPAQPLQQQFRQCPQDKIYLPIEGNSYNYIECKDFQPITRTCPEGYFFNSQAQWPENPCLQNIAAQRVPTLEPQLTNLPQVLLTPSCENIRNAYIDLGLCDSYTECRNFKPIKRVCPDGLNYNPAAKWPAYPCSYPNEAPCLGRQQIQVPKPTAECQRQYGIFPSPKAAANECGRYVICSAGYAYDMTCPLGLAFNPATSSCDWPYNVPSCNVNDFYGMQCPPAEIDESGNPVVVNLKYGNDCQYFFSCQSGEGRLLSCDPGYAFNAASGRCENADYVDCSAGISKVGDLVYQTK